MFTTTFDAAGWVDWAIAAGQDPLAHFVERHRSLYLACADDPEREAPDLAIPAQRSAVIDELILRGRIWTRGRLWRG